MIARVAAQAKLNLDLRILAREKSGYHQLETIFQRIELADDVCVTVTPGTGITLVQAPATDIPVAHNLAVRAAQAYQQASPWARTQAIAITIEKRIPIGGGLGGGSADAGAVLRALQALSPAPLAADTLLTLAATLGADVPFLASDCALALAWGRGERCVALPALPALPVTLVTSTQGVPTPEAYAWLAAAREAGTIPAAGAHVHQLPALQQWRDVAIRSRNDFESVVLARRADLAADFGRLLASAPLLARMSGSGATLFAVHTAGDVPLPTGLHGTALRTRTATRVAAVTCEA